MRNTALRLTETASGLTVPDLPGHVEGWLLDGEIRQHSPQTLAIRRTVTQKLLWYLNTQGFAECGLLEMRRFFAYIGKGHEAEGGRWGNTHLTKPVTARTVHSYHNHLRTFFRWLVAEGIQCSSPMEAIATPVHRSDQIQPFTEAQIGALLAAAGKTVHPRRDEAIVSFLLDTGVRASELCGLRRRDLDMAGRRCTVLGKGNKHRAVYFGRRTTKALWSYLREQERGPDAPLFLSDRGAGAGEPLTRSGLAQLIRRLGIAARVEAVRCSPHTFRSTFAVTFLRNGGNSFSLMSVLGHTNIQMTSRYVALAQADVENQHRQFSPMDRLRK